MMTDPTFTRTDILDAFPDVNAASIRRWLGPVPPRQRPNTYTLRQVRFILTMNAITQHVGVRGWGLPRQILSALRHILIDHEQEIAEVEYGPMKLKVHMMKWDGQL